MCYFLPGRDVGGRFENQLDTFYMIANSRLIIGLLAIDLVAINLFNVAGMRITSTLGALFRSVLEAVRTLNVWLLDLALFYYYSPDLGESWSPKWSWLQAIGFGVLVSSALVYGKGNAFAGALAAAEAAEAEGEEEVERLLEAQSPAPVTPPPARAQPGRPPVPVRRSPFLCLASGGHTCREPVQSGRGAASLIETSGGLLRAAGEWPIASCELACAPDGSILRGSSAQRRPPVRRKPYDGVEIPHRVTSRLGAILRLREHLVLAQANREEPSVAMQRCPAALHTTRLKSLQSSRGSAARSSEDGGIALCARVVLPAAR